MDLNREDRVKPTINETIEALKAGQDKGVPASDVFYGLSDLTTGEINTLKPVWNNLDAGYRRKVVSLLVEASELNFELDYGAFGLFTLNDPEETVRSATVNLLWEDESLDLLHRLIEICNEDPSINVRALALGTLGRFILLGEYEEIPESEAEKAQATAIALFNDHTVDIEVRRRALEAISNSSHDRVPAMIKEAYDHSEHKMQVSAIFAMGRSYDPRWSEFILKELESDDPEKRYEATRASGELELVEAVPRLARLLVEEDREVQETAVWALGEIGGREAIRVLEAFLNVMEENEDKIMIEAIEDALSNADFMSGGNMFASLDGDF